MELQIRLAQEPDIPVLAAFEREISLISFGGEAIVDEAFHQAKIRKALLKNNKGMFVMTAGDEIAGWLWMDPRTNSLTGETYIHFRSLYVAEAWRGNAESERLLARGMAFGRETGAKSFVGKVHVQNLAMRALYKNAGFKATHLTMEYDEPC